MNAEDGIFFDAVRVGNLSSHSTSVTDSID
jgi:hypothetical protein